MTPAEFRRQVQAASGADRRAVRSPQANLAILPQEQADAFLAFCRANARACPLLGVAEPGAGAPPDPGPGPGPAHGRAGLLRLPGRAAGGTRRTILDLWAGPGGLRHRLPVLVRTGAPGGRIPSTRRLEGRNVLNVTGIANVPVAPLRRADGGVHAADAGRRRHPGHPDQRAVSQGARGPGHLGDPALIGIADLGRPDYGDPVTVRPGNCRCPGPAGSRPDALREARLPLAITHQPGHMLITDLANEALATAIFCCAFNLSSCYPHQFVLRGLGFPLRVKIDGKECRSRR